MSHLCKLSLGKPNGFCCLKGVADALELVAGEAEAQVRGNPALQVTPVSAQAVGRLI